MSSKRKQKRHIRENHLSSIPPQIDATQAARSADLPLELQQAVLDVFVDALRLVDSAELFSVIQLVKGHLYNRDFSSAFGKEDYLTAYALRWSASRALAYAEIFASLNPQCLAPKRPAESTTPPKVVCIGGGAGAELVGLAAAVQYLSLPEIQIHIVDMAEWSYILNKLLVSTETCPPPSAFAGASATTSTKSLLGAGQITMRFDRQDVLEYPGHDGSSQLQSMLAGASLVTIMFTLNELFTSSVPKTIALLLALTNATEPGSFLLVVDSPGRYSEVSIGGSQKRYPMQWLLNHTLLEVAGTTENRKWTRHFTHDSKWFRIDPKLKYRLDLENMRYQIHLYQRLDTAA